jgi:lipopolysaccharide export system protein LptA
MKKLAEILAVAFVAAMVASDAWGEKADRSKPIHVEADTLTADEANRVSIYTGRVTFTQGTLVLKADKVSISEDPAGFRFATAWGNPVSFRQKREGKDEYIEGYAQRMEYDGKQEKMELIGSARVTRGADELRGNRISYDSPTEFYRVTGTPEGGRVRAIIMPKGEKADAGRSPVGLKPETAAPREQ